MFEIFVLFNASLLIKLTITDCVKTGWEVEDDPYKAFVARAVAKANKESNNTYQLVDLEVIETMVESKEEVYLYEVTILAGQTNCAKNALVARAIDKMNRESTKPFLYMPVKKTLTVNTMHGHNYEPPQPKKIDYTNCEAKADPSAPKQALINS
ncbi:hypothetical protein niasHT_017727 [Heterodera trifolii]|uniref:Cystatin domain-containing protein n=1 Tax=Heterodera trifolii TaxID=157864 RepID=A0ABD2L706_9BILA